MRIRTWHLSRASSGRELFQLWYAFFYTSFFDYKFNAFRKIVLCCLVYNSPRCSLAGDALKAIDDGVELYSMRVFDNTALSLVRIES